MIRLSIRVTGNAAKVLAGLPDALGRAIRQWVLLGGQLVRGVMVEEIRGRQKQGTGFLSNSVQASYEAAGFTVAATADYASFVDQPTRPHVIRPVNAKALAFPAPGGSITRNSSTGHVRTKFTTGGSPSFGPAVFARLVHHPGTRGLFFVDATATRSTPVLVHLLGDLVDAEVKAAGES